MPTKLSYWTVQPDRWTSGAQKIRDWAEAKLKGRVLNACAGQTHLGHDGPIVRNDLDADVSGDESAQPGTDRPDGGLWMVATVPEFVQVLLQGGDRLLVFDQPEGFVVRFDLQDVHVELGRCEVVVSEERSDQSGPVWALDDRDWLAQSPDQTSYVSPWVVITPDWTNVEGDDADPDEKDATPGEIDPSTDDAIARAISQYIGVTL